ncbi:MAG: aldose 1-epimerase family protein [Phocaeicola sp.]
MEKLSNSLLSISVSKEGAELQSIQKNGHEYLWHGDAQFWDRRSPILFPLVGRVWGDEFSHNDKLYPIGQHGFARDLRFELVKHTADELLYKLVSTPEMLLHFPFSFVLYAGYQLVDNKLVVTWKVENPGSEDLFFQIGAHPAFNLPDFDLQSQERGYFRFSPEKELKYLIPTEKGCVSPVHHSLQLADGWMPITADTFACDTYVFDDNQLERISLYDKEKKPYLAVEFDAPLLGLWAPTNSRPDCPFVCIEPWYGCCDEVGYNGLFTERKWTQRLAPQGVFEASYTIVIA